MEAKPADALDAAAIRGALGRASHRFAALDVVMSCGSTNSELLNRPLPSTGAVALLADCQTAGRGRHGRSWVSPPDANLYLSLGYRWQGPAVALSGLSIALGVAVASALRPLGATAIGLKWPNDLILQGRKLGGLLIETGSMAGEGLKLVIGLGLNVRMPVAVPVEIEQPWIDLAAALGRATPSRNELAATLLTALLDALECFSRAGLSAFLPDWPDYDILANQPVSVLEGAKEHRGIAIGLTTDGALRVRQAEGEFHYRSADVSLRSA